MKKHIVCFGDSNTHGYCADPADTADGGVRFNESERWTCLLQKQLGDDYLVIEEGLSGRTTSFDDPLLEGLSGLDYITPCLRSHADVDLLIIMLGTNDTKDRFSVNPYCITLGLDRLVKKAMYTECWGEKKPNILVICPPPIGDNMISSPLGPVMGVTCAEKSRELPRFFEEQCKLLGVHYLDAGKIGCEFNTIDYMHLTAKGHATLATALGSLVPGLVE